MKLAAGQLPINRAMQTAAPRFHVAVSAERRTINYTAAAPLVSLTDLFRRLPLLTIFGERNDPLRFQPRWKQLYSDARKVVVRKGNHFPMCDDPDLVAASIWEWHHDRVVSSLP